MNWKLVGYTLAGCWMMCALTFLPGKQIGLFLNPLPILLKGLAGIVVFGYVGGFRFFGDVGTIFVYWNVIGLLLAWSLHKTQHIPGAVNVIVTVAAVLHVVLSALALFPTMLLAGR
jgi:hypothetical protein